MNNLTMFGNYLFNKHGRRVHKISILTDMTCPNRDGQKGLGGCTYCNNESFNPTVGKGLPSITEQILTGKSAIRKRKKVSAFLAYFQAYSNTYGSVEHLKSLYDEALKDPEIIGLSIATRPDCLADDVLDLIASYRYLPELWLEIGLQSRHNKTLETINRGHTYEDFVDAVKRSHQKNIMVCSHVIFGLPGESEEMMMDSIEALKDLGIEGVKFHPLHLVRETILASQYLNNPFRLLTIDEYAHLVVKALKILSDNCIVQRLTGTASREILIAPEWCSSKWQVTNRILSLFSQESSILDRTNVKETVLPGNFI